MDHVVLPKRVIPQPVPFRSQGGDCAACCVGAITGLTVDEVYAKLNDGRIGMGWPTVARCLHLAEKLGLIDRFVEDLPMWPHNVPTWTAAWGAGPGWWFGLPWWRYVRMALDAGYYVIANVAMSRRGAVDPVDHAVLIVGARVLRAEGRVTRHELLVSCSSRSTPDEEWVEVHEFLRQRGGYNVLLARPAEH